MGLEERNNRPEGPRARKLAEAVRVEAKGWFRAVGREITFARDVARILVSGKDYDKVEAGQTKEPVNRASTTPAHGGLGDRIRQDQAVRRKKTTPPPANPIRDEEKKAQIEKIDGTVWNSLALLLKDARA